MKLPDGGKGPDGGREPDGVEEPDGALPLFIGGGDRLGGEGVLNTHRMARLLTTHFFAPPHQQSWSPPPINRGRAPSGLYPIRTITPHGLLSTHS